MTYLILGIVLLLLLLLAGKWFISADPKSLARILKPLLIIFGVIIVLLLVFTGKLIWVFWAMPFLVPMYMRWRHAARWAKNTSRMSSGGASGMASEVTSKYLDMRLDHDSGDMTGTVRTGMYEGAQLSDLNLQQLLDLYQEYTERDSESARLLGAYLDRMHPDWRDQGADTGQQGDEGFAEGSGTMSRAEAFRILGISETADEAEIKSAHHRLIAGLHPDRGGSAYLAAKINEARDVLLKS